MITTEKHTVKIFNLFQFFVQDRVLHKALVLKGGPGTARDLQGESRGSPAKSYPKSCADQVSPSLAI